MTLDETTFRIAYLNPDRTWTVGWKGPAVELDGILTLSDDNFPVDDSYRWSVRDGALTLDFHETTDILIRNIPSEVYSHAHFSRPLRSVDCTPADLDACLQD